MLQRGEVGHNEAERSQLPAGLTIEGKHMTKTLARLSLATAIIGFAAVPALAATQSSAHTGKVSMSEARQIALRAYPGGRIVKQELEHEHGGSGLRYSFDMRKGNTWREVGVDAMTAKVLENSPEGTHPKD
jgi:uncharacterized membrane protein YkoI